MKNQYIIYKYFVWSKKEKVIEIYNVINKYHIVQNKNYKNVKYQYLKFIYKNHNYPNFIPIQSTMVSKLKLKRKYSKEEIDEIICKEGI
jgi:hypothetical protein